LGQWVLLTAKTILSAGITERLCELILLTAEASRPGSALSAK
jgi:hypothetical protein